MKYRGEIGVGKVYLFTLICSGYATIIIRNDISNLLRMILCIIFIASSIILYRRSKGWILAAVTPLPFLFLTLGAIAMATVGLGHFTTTAAGALCVLSILALVVFTLLHNLEKSMEEDR